MTVTLEPSNAQQEQNFLMHDMFSKLCMSINILPFRMIHCTLISILLMAVAGDSDLLPLTAREKVPAVLKESVKLRLQLFVFQSRFSWSGVGLDHIHN